MNVDGKRCFLWWDRVNCVFAITLDDEKSDCVTGDIPKRLAEDALFGGATEVRWTGEACLEAYKLGLL